MTEQEDTRRKSRRDLLLVLLILPFGVLCMFMTGQVAIRLAPTWVLNADMRSLLDPNAQFGAGGIPVYIEPLDPGILTLPAWGDLFLTPNAAIPTRLVLTATPLPPRTPPPPPAPTTHVEEPKSTATVPGPIILPTNTGPLLADLDIEKSDNSATYTPGTAINYTVRVTNLGPNTAIRFNVIDEIPEEVSGLTVNCAPADRCGTNNSSGNRVSFTGANLPSTGANQITISVSGIVSPRATGQLINTAEIVIPSGSRFRDPNLSNNSVTDSDRQLSIHDLAITKSDGVGINTYTASSPITYTVVLTNSGPSNARGINIQDSIPAQIATWTWTCSTVINAGNCDGVTNSTSNFNDRINIQSGGRIEYSVIAIPAGIPQNISNTASIVLPSDPGVVDPNLSNNSSTDLDIPYVDLQITKNDGVTTYAPGGTVTYTVTVTNNSTFNLTGITVSDPKPAQVTTWSWSCAGGCTPVTNSNSNFTDTISLAAGSNLVYTVVANTLGAGGPIDLTNIATVSVPAGLVDAVPANNSATDIDTPALNVDLQITKDDGVLVYNPNGTLNYTVVVTNNSAINLNGVTVVDNRPASISSWTWTCAPNPGPPGASCTPGPSNANINDTAVNLPAGASVVYAITATVTTYAIGPLVNTASVSPPAGFVDVAPGNNVSTDSDINAVGEPDVGPPDGNVYTIPNGGTAAFYLGQPIIANGDPAADFVFYEYPMAPGIRLDQVIIEISLDGAVWHPVFFWGNNIADTNTNVDNVNIPNIANACPTEADNCTIVSSDLYNNTGISIDVDNSPLSNVPQGNYSWIRFTEPNLPGNDGDNTHVDAIEILP